MTAYRTKRVQSLLSLLLVLVLAFATLSITVLADEADGADEIPTNEGEITSPSDTDGNADETTATDSKGTATDGKTDDTDTDKDDKKTVTNAIISWAIVVVVLAVIAIICIRKRDKVGPFFKALKSESKNVVWLKRKDLIKCTTVTLVLIVVLAVVIGVLDFAFSKGVIALGGLF